MMRSDHGSDVSRPKAVGRGTHIDARNAGSTQNAVPCWRLLPGKKLKLATRSACMQLNQIPPILPRSPAFACSFVIHIRPLT